MVANPKTDFAQRLQQACDEAPIPITQGRGRRAELVRQLKFNGLNLSGESIRKWLAGDSIPSMDNGRKLALTLNVTVEWLLTGREPMHPAQNALSNDPPSDEIIQILRDRLASGVHGSALLTILVNEPWNDEDLAPLAIMANALIAARIKGTSSEMGKETFKPDSPLRRPGRAPNKLTGS